MRARRILPLVLLTVPATALAHDLFLKLESFFVPPNRPARVTVINGTFTTSENAIVRSRIADLSVVGPAGRTTLDSSALVSLTNRSRITVPVGGPGTYVAALSIRPNEIELTGEEFRAYLAAEGLDAVIEARRAAGTLDRAVKERYAKHVKAVFRAARAGGEGWSTVFGYPVEIVPLADPYTLKRGDTLRVRLLVAGRPAPAGTVLLAGGRNQAGTRLQVQRLASDAEGSAAIVLRSTGTWYAKFIHMTPGSGGADYVSEWATLTWAVR